MRRSMTVLPPTRTSAVRVEGCSPSSSRASEMDDDSQVVAASIIPSLSSTVVGESHFFDEGKQGRIY